jgi:hypothetical protein
VAGESERDEDLDELQKELEQPFIEEPDELDEGAGQTCFINQDRMCRADCTAFNIYAQPAQGPERCIMLVYLAATATNTEALVQLGKGMKKRARVQADDEARAAVASAPIPDPFGGKR